MTVVADKEGGKVFDLITVIGEASFIDDLQKQELHGEKIMVWLEKPQEGDKKPKAMGGPKQELHRVFAQDRVRAFSPDFVIRRADRLTMTFLPEQVREERLPTLPTVVAKPPAERPGDGIIIGPPPPGAKIDPKGPPAIESKTPPPAKKPAPPIELQGNEITMAIATLAGKKELHEMIAKGNVYVFQAGDTPGEKRIDITGRLLTINTLNKENDKIMVVHGDQKNLARVEMGEMILWGPLVTIDQSTTRTKVDGQGAMQMPSNKNLDGTDAPKSKGKTTIAVYWNKNMTFDGREACYYGGVQAFQQGTYSRLLCENLTAILDKFVSFKEGQKKDEPAKVDRIFCDKNVYIDDSQVDEKKDLVQRNILEGRLLVTDNAEGPTVLYGKGRVRLLAKGTAQLDLAPPPGTPGTAAAPLVWKLTRVEFPERMFSNTKAANKNAKFYANQGTFVEVFHFPFAPGQKILIEAGMDPDSPPKDGLYLRCEYLEVEGRQQGDKTTQYMIAKHNAYFKTDKYTGSADIITYNEATDIMTLEGLNGNQVRLNQIGPDGRLTPRTVNSSKVLYNRKTGQVESAGVKSITN